MSKKHGREADGDDSKMGITPKGSALVEQYKASKNPNIDYRSYRVDRKDCGCVTTVVNYEKDCGGFEDDREASVTDFCDEHETKKVYLEGLSPFETPKGYALVKHYQSTDDVKISFTTFKMFRLGCGCTETRVEYDVTSTDHEETCHSTVKDLCKSHERKKAFDKEAAKRPLQYERCDQGWLHHDEQHRLHLECGCITLFSTLIMDCGCEKGMAHTSVVQSCSNPHGDKQKQYVTSTCKAHTQDEQ